MIPIHSRDPVSMGAMGTLAPMVLFENPINALIKLDILLSQTIYIFMLMMKVSTHVLKILTGSLQG